MSYPLEGLRVLDMSRVLAGPFAGRMLCDLGADVVKVEPPEGDITRYWGAEVGGLRGYFHQQNVGKRGICVDLRQPEASQLHDFSAFRAAGCQASTPLRKISKLVVERRQDWVTITVTANAFLQHMVRNISGLLVAIGAGGEPPEWAATVLASRDRTTAGITAPAHGLTLLTVAYPERFAVPAENDFVYDASL